jgi:transposase
MEVTTIGLDLAKRVFQVHGVDVEGRIVLRRKLGRAEVLTFFAKVPSCLVGMEACGSAHHWAREIAALGHEVRLMPASYVKPYVKRGKTDAADAEAICEAVGRPTMRFVPVKTPEQQAVLLLHRARDLLVRQRTGLVNAIRGHMAEFGIVAPQGVARVQDLVALLVGDSEEGAKLPALARCALRMLAAETAALARRLEEIEAAILAWHKENESSQRLAGVPGIGPITASAIVATVGMPPRSVRPGTLLHGSVWFPSNTAAAVSSGREASPSKQGDRYLRRLLVLGATSLIRQARTKAGQGAIWLLGLLERRSARLASVAQANKTARIVWALLARGDPWRRSSTPPSNGWTGSTTAASSSRSVTCHRLKRRRATTPALKRLPWPPNPNQSASSIPGAVH